jgi:hypothetical protein
MPISPIRWPKVFSVIICTLPLAASACGVPFEPPTPTMLAETTEFIEPTKPIETIEITEVIEEVKPSQPVTNPQKNLSAEKPEVDRTYCDDVEIIHPVGESIARTYEIPYSELINIYCEGYEFEEILLALETEEQSGLIIGEILKMRDEGLSWEEIWKELGIVD